jgi:hypothetical protein
MFEIATRNKFRFETPRGQITTEDLWDLPLTGRGNQPNLDDIAKDLHRKLKTTGEEVSFVTPVVKTTDDLQTKFDIVKHIIDVRIVERDAAMKATARREQKQKIMKLIEQKKDAALSESSLEELQALFDSAD